MPAEYPEVPGLAEETVRAAMNVDAPEGGTSRAIISGAIVIYPTDAAPAWLEPILAARNEDGDLTPQTHYQRSVADPSCEAWLVEYRRFIP